MVQVLNNTLNTDKLMKNKRKIKPDSERIRWMEGESDKAPGL
jgi:hypothetical protein